MPVTSASFDGEPDGTPFVPPKSAAPAALSDAPGGGGSFASRVAGSDQSTLHAGRNATKHAAIDKDRRDTRVLPIRHCIRFHPLD